MKNLRQICGVIVLWAGFLFGCAVAWFLCPEVLIVMGMLLLTILATES